MVRMEIGKMGLEALIVEFKFGEKMSITMYEQNIIIY